MANWKDVERVAGSLPEAQHRSGNDGLRSWRVRDRLFVSERPLRESDRRAVGDLAPRELIVGAWTERALRRLIDQFEAGV